MMSPTILLSATWRCNKCPQWDLPGSAAFKAPLGEQNTIKLEKPLCPLVGPHVVQNVPFIFFRPCPSNSLSPPLVSRVVEKINAQGVCVNKQALPQSRIAKILIFVWLYLSHYISEHLVCYLNGSQESPEGNLSFETKIMLLHVWVHV